MAIRRDHGANSLTWINGGKLQRADQVTGPWQTLTVTLGPYVVQPPTATTFYRVAPPRLAKLYVPSSYDGQTPIPLVLLLHGGGGTGQSVEDWMQFRPLAEARGFLYSYPDGTPYFALNGFGWNATDAASDPATDWGGSIVDDAGYLRDLIREIGQHFAVDRKRVYVVGHSNGGMMAYRMACQFADLIAGIVSLAGPMYFDPGQCSPSEPVSILHINGTADVAAFYWGGAGTPPTFQLNTTPTPGAFRALQMWGGYNGVCNLVTDPAPSLDLVLNVAGLDTIITRCTNAPPGRAVELWTITDGPHHPTLSSGFPPCRCQTRSRAHATSGADAIFPGRDVRWCAPLVLRSSRSERLRAGTRAPCSDGFGPATPARPRRTRIPGRRRFRPNWARLAGQPRKDKRA